MYRVNVCGGGCTFSYGHLDCQRLTSRCLPQSHLHFVCLFILRQGPSLALTILARLAGGWGPAIYLFLCPHSPRAEVADTRPTFYTDAMGLNSGLMLVWQTLCLLSHLPQTQLYFSLFFFFLNHSGLLYRLFHMSSDEASDLCSSLLPSSSVTCHTYLKGNKTSLLLNSLLAHPTPVSRTLTPSSLSPPQASPPHEDSSPVPTPPHLPTLYSLLLCRCPLPYPIPCHPSKQSVF